MSRPAPPTLPAATDPLLFVSPRGDLRGAPQEDLARLLRYLDHTLWAPVLLAPAPGELSTLADTLGVPTWNLTLGDPSAAPWWRRPAAAVAMLRARRVLRRDRIKLIWVADRTLVVPLRAAARDLPVSLVWHAHDPTPSVHDRANADAADLVIGASNGIALRLASLGGRGNVACIPSAVDTTRFAPRDPAAARRTLGHDDQEVPILYLGSLAPHRGLADLLTALGRVLERHPRAALWIATRDAAYETRRRAEAAEAGVADRVRWLAPGLDPADLLRAAAVFVQPSHREEPSRALLEAMSSATPVVASDLPGNRELISPERTGLLVPPHDPDALAAALETVLDDPARATALGQAARARVQEAHAVPAWITAVDIALRNQLR